MGNKNDPSGESVVIVDSFYGSAGSLSNVDQSKRFRFNQQLPPQSKGVYIGGGNPQDTNQHLFVEESDGSIVPYRNIVAGIVHPIYPRRIIKDDRQDTTATEIVVQY